MGLELKKKHTCLVSQLYFWLSWGTGGNEYNNRRDLELVDWLLFVKHCKHLKIFSCDTFSDGIDKCVPKIDLIQNGKFFFKEKGKLLKTILKV